MATSSNIGNDVRDYLNESQQAHVMKLTRTTILLWFMFCFMFFVSNRESFSESFFFLVLNALRALPLSCCEASSLRLTFVLINAFDAMRDRVHFLVISLAAECATGTSHTVSMDASHGALTSLVFCLAGRRWDLNDTGLGSPPRISTVITAQSGDTAFLPCHVPLREEHGVSVCLTSTMHNQSRLLRCWLACWWHAHVEPIASAANVQTKGKVDTNHEFETAFTEHAFKAWHLIKQKPFKRAMHNDNTSVIASVLISQPNEAVRIEMFGCCYR